MSSILVKLPNWMGDILFSYDLLFSLSKSFENMAVLTSRQHARLFEIFPVEGVQVLSYPDRAWPSMDTETRLRIRNFAADWGLLLPNSIGAALALRRSGVTRLAGYNSEYRGFLLEKSMSMPSRRLHQTEYYLNLASLFDVEPQSYPVSLHSKKPSFVVIHPGASKRERAWNLDRFIEVADALQALDKQILFVSGEKLPPMPYPTAIKPSLFEFAGLLKECSLFIGNDSGPLHLAQQCGAPVVGVYGPGDPFVTGPRDISLARVVYHAYPCSPCRQRFFKECDPAPTGKPYCIETIATQEVVRAALELLEAGAHGAPASAH